MSSHGHDGGGGAGGHFSGFDITNHTPGQSARFQGQPQAPGQAPPPTQADPAKAESATYVRYTRHGSPQVIRGRYVILTGLAIAIVAWILIELFRMFITQ